jgi:hypothetical protein
MEKIDLFKAYFTQESKYYADKLDRFDQGHKFTFNFEAGFFGLIWFCYRKMYKQALILAFYIFLLGLVAGIILSIFNPNDSSNVLYIKIVTWVISFTILGFIGNNLYIMKSKSIVADFLTKYEIDNIDNKVLDKLREKGGTSIQSSLICLGLSIIIQVISKIYS